MFSWIIGILSGIFYMALHPTNTGAFPPPLSAAEEAELIAKMEQGDAAARQKLIEHNLRLVAHVVKKYYSERVEQDDLISIGTIGLIKGISTFNSGKGIKLATYAARCVENAILTQTLFYQTEALCVGRLPASFFQGVCSLFKN